VIKSILDKCGVAIFSERWSKRGKHRFNLSIMGKAKRNRNKRHNQVNASRGKLALNNSPRATPSHLTKKANLSASNPPKSVWRWMVEHPLVLTISFLSAVVSLVIAYFYFQSAVTISARPMDHLTNPFDQEFLICNKGALPIYDVFCHWELANVNHNEDSKYFPVLGVVTTSKKVVEPNETFSANIAYDKDLIPTVESADIDINVVYKPSFWPNGVSSTTRFELSKRSDGTFSWLEDGIPERKFMPVKFVSSWDVPKNAMPTATITNAP
jgi:hypothetical protein